jgi:hypothetical protein
MPMNSTNFLQNALVVTVSLLLSLLLAEGAVRMTVLGKIHVAETGNQYKFYEFDERLGWKNGTGRHGQYTRDEFSYGISINRHGMRYREVQQQKPAGVTRVAVLGDSFVWGIGVSDHDRFTEMVEKRSAGEFELLNFGVSGYGPVQHYLMFDEIVAGFRPDIVLVTFCLGNDFADNVFWRRYNYYKPYVQEITGPDVAIAGYPLPRSGEFAGGLLTDWLADHSRLYALTMSSARRAAASFNDYGQNGLVGADENQKDIYFPRHSPGAAALADQMVDMNAKLLMKLRQKAKAHNVRLAVVVAPTKCEYGACFPGETARNMNALNRLIQTLKELDIPAIDKTEAIDLADFWKTDAHWRPSGHAKLADGILDWLNSSSLPKNLSKN